MLPAVSKNGSIKPLAPRYTSGRLDFTAGNTERILVQSPQTSRCYSCKLMMARMLRCDQSHSTYYRVPQATRWPFREGQSPFYFEPLHQASKACGDDLDADMSYNGRKQDRVGSRLIMPVDRDPLDPPVVACSWVLIKVDPRRLQLTSAPRHEQYALQFLWNWKEEWS
jgi:hypothetical protein